MWIVELPTFPKPNQKVSEYHEFETKEAAERFRAGLHCQSWIYEVRNEFNR